MPRFWKVPKKATKWAVSPRPGPHKKFECLPLQVIVRDILKLAETGKEAKLIIRKGEISVDGTPRKDHAFPVGLFDVVHISRLNQLYRVVPTSVGLQLITIPKEESKLKICKINNKTVVENGKLQLNLNDGKNILASKGEYSTGDSLLIEVPTLKIIEHLPLKKGYMGIVASGKNSGKVGEIKEVIKGGIREQARVVCSVENETEEVLKEHFFVIGKDKPLITVSG